MENGKEKRKEKRKEQGRKRGGGDNVKFESELSSKWGTGRRKGEVRKGQEHDGIKIEEG